MSVDLRLPNINATTNEGKIEQLQSFVYQLVQELNFCLNLLEKKTNDVSSEVFDSKGNSKIEVNTNNILLKVEQGDSISDINLSPEGIKIDASKINLNGYTTINGNFSVDENGNLIISGPDYTIRGDADGYRLGGLQIYNNTTKNGMSLIDHNVTFLNREENGGYGGFGVVGVTLDFFTETIPECVYLGTTLLPLKLYSSDDIQISVPGGKSGKLATQEWVTDNFQAKT